MILNNVLSVFNVKSKTNYDLIQRVKLQPQASEFLSSVQWVHSHDNTWHICRWIKVPKTSLLLWNLITLTCFSLSLSPSPAGEDAARCAMSSFNLCPSSVFRRSLLPADEWEEAHMDLPGLWQACSLWAAHYWWVRRQKHALTRSHTWSAILLLINSEKVYSETLAICGLRPALRLFRMHREGVNLLFGILHLLSVFIRNFWSCKLACLLTLGSTWCNTATI